MNGLKAAVVGSRGVVAVSGPAAREFLQGLVTSDVDGLETGQARNAALLTPQGKILFEFIVYAAGPERFLLDTWGAAAEDLARRLMFYRLRARVEIEVLTDHIVLAFWDGEATPDVDGVFADPRLATLGWRAIVAADGADTAMEGSENATEDAYQAHRIGFGVAEFGIDYPTGETFPHEADLDQLGGVDFDKGCYIGQEVVSRMQHRGTARSRFVPVLIDGPAPEAGTSVEASGKAVGTMGSARGTHGLARLRLDRVGVAIEAAAPIRAGEATLHLIRPDWAAFQWPGDQAESELVNKRNAPPRAWQRMLSGRRLDLLDPSPLDVEISDIALGLARVARWNGQTTGKHAFSVAEHSLLVEDLMGRMFPDMERKWRLAALLHDGPEYVIGDMISPFKAVLGDGYKGVEHRILEAIHLRFGLPAKLPATVTKSIKRADIAAAFLEATQLAGFTHDEAAKLFGRPGPIGGAKLDEVFKLEALPVVLAEERFLARFAQLEG